MTAAAQLDRILHIIPMAAREGGAGYEELARSLDIDRDQLLDDLEAVTAREFYHPAGTAADIQVGLEPERVRVWTAGTLRRPVRLDRWEAAALHLGLRILAEERDDPELVGAMRRVQDGIAWAGNGDAAEAIVAGELAARDALRATLVDAAGRRLQVELDYLKPDAAEPESRSVDPFVVVFAEGHSYLIGHDHDRAEIRVFRLDRVLEARVTKQSFTAPSGFDPADFLDSGKVYRADAEVEVTVRYSSRVARWVIERGGSEIREDGSVILTHTVADPGWIVRHVLRYGPDAEVLEPSEARGWVREVLQGTRAAAT